MRGLLLCLAFVLSTSAVLAAQGISPDTRAWLSDTLIVLMDGTYGLDHARDVVATVRPDLMDWHFGIYGNIGDVYRRNGVRVSGGAWQREYQEYVTWYDREWKLRMDQFHTNGVGRRLNGDPVWDSRERYCASMCHNAPKWHTWHNQGLLMPVGLADTISQDNIDVAGFIFGRGAFCNWCLRGFRDYLRERFTAAELAQMGVPDVARLDFAEYLRETYPEPGPEVLEDPLCREYLKYQHISMLDNWRDVCRKVREEAARRGVPVPPIYGNQYAAQTNSFGLHQCTEVDVVWIEDGLRLPTATNNHAWSALRYTVGRAAGGRGQPVWSCLYPSSADARLTVLSEALANGGVHVANSPSEQYQQFSRFVRDNRHLFTRRQPVARVGLIASPTTWMWGQFPGLGLRDSRPRDLFGAAARALADSHVPYGAVVFGHPEVVDERPCLSELDRYRVVVAAGVECLSEGQEAALRRFIQRGGHLVTLGDFGIYDEDHVPRTPPDLPATALAPEQAEALLAGAESGTDIAAARRAFADAVTSGPEEERLIRTDAGPLVWVSLWQRPGRRLDIHLVNYDMPSGDLVPVEPCEVTVAVPDGLSVSTASLVGPELPRREIDLRREGSLAHLTVAAFRSYVIISIGDRAEMAAAAEMARAAKAVDRLRVAGEDEAAPRLAADLAEADRSYTDTQYQAAAAVARRVAGAAETALADAVARRQAADAAERLARIERGAAATRAFDLGPEPTDGWLQITERTTYDAQRGFGWMITDGLAGAGGTEPDPLHGDWITSEQPRTLRVDLEPGAYRVSIITGELNESYHWGGDVEVNANGRPMLVGIKRRGGVWRSDEFVTDVTDGVLRLTFSARPAWWPMTYEHEWSAAGVIVESASPAPRGDALPLTEWLVSGPYDDRDWTGIQAADRPPDGQPWHSYATPPGVPIVDFRHLFTADDEAMFRARSALVAERPCEGELCIGLQARGRVWLNGELILHDEKASGLSADEYVLPVSLAEGVNLLDVLTSTDWIGASLTASLRGADGVSCAFEQLPEAAAGPIAEYPEPVLVLDRPTLTLGVPSGVSVRFTNASERSVRLVTLLAAPDEAEMVDIEPLDGQEAQVAAPGETVTARYRVTMTEPVDSVDQWHGWSRDVPGRVKLVATVRCGDQERVACRWVPALSPRLVASVTRAATAERPAELHVELTNPTDQAISGAAALLAPDGWAVVDALPESLAAEPGETAAAIATLQPGEGVASGEYPAHVTFSFRPGGGRPIELRATAVVALVGIAGQWHFDEGEGGVAADASPNHNDGTVQPGVAWAPGYRGQALRFDGAGCVEVPHSESLSIASSITVEAWVKPERFVGNDMIVVKTDYANEYLLYADARGTLHGRVRNGGSGRQDVVSAPGVLEPGVWQHIAFTWDTRAARLYCNGALLKEIETQRPAIGTNTAPMCIGGGAYAGGFHGLIDEVTIRTGALGPEDIRALYDQAR